MKDIYNKKEEKKNAGASRALPIVCIVLSVLLGIFSVINLILSLTAAATGRPPNIGGITPAIVYTESMESSREDSVPAGSLILSDGSALVEAHPGEVILFFHEGHLWVGRVVTRGENGLTVKADDSKHNYPFLVTEDMYLGRVTTRATGFGQLAMFLNTGLGIFLFGIVPLGYCLYVLIDEIRIAARNRKGRGAPPASTNEEAPDEAAEGAPDDTPEAVTTGG